MSRRVLVTGGAGFIGSHLVERLISAGDEVAVADNLSRGRRTWIHSGANFHELDIRDGAAVRHALRLIAPDVVVHLAAMHFIPAVEDAPGLASEVNVGGTRALLEALEPTPPDVFLFASTAAVYPDRLGPIDESCAPGPIDLYGRTKLEGERLVTEFAKASGTRCVVVRLFNVVGRRETNPHVVPDLVGQLRRNAAPVRLGNLEAKRDYTDVLDVATALERLLSARLDGLKTFNLGSGRSVSVADLVHVCERILGRPIDVETENRRLRAHDRAELLADPGLLRTATGWEPMRSLQETIADLLTEAEPA